MDQASKLRQLMMGQRNKKTQEEQHTENSVEQEAVQEQVDDTLTNSKAHDMQIITIASGKGGVGKSNFAANLALTLQKLGKRTVVLDADFGFANIDVILNVSSKYSFVDLLKDKLDITDVLAEGPEGIKFVSGVCDVFKLSEVETESVNHLIESFNKLSEIADILIIDTGAGLQESALRFMRISNDILIVTTPEPTAITDAYALIKSLVAEDLIGSQQLHFMVNMAENQKEAEDVHLRLGTAVNKFLNLDIKMLGYTPYDRNIIQAVKARQPVTLFAPKSKVSQAIQRIGESLIEGRPITQENRKSIGSIVKGLLGL